MNVLLQILDDGEITDSHGRKVNFENTVIVMTSNAGSERKEGTVGFGHTVNEQNRDRAMKALGEFLRPEFLNRVDEVICFNRLDEKNFAGIAHIMLDELQKSLEDKGLHFTWDEDVEDYLVKKSYSATYGARGTAPHHLRKSSKTSWPRRSSTPTSTLSRRSMRRWRTASAPSAARKRKGRRPCSICSGKDIEKHCAYCKSGSVINEGQVICSRRGVVDSGPTTAVISATIRLTACAAPSRHAERCTRLRIFPCKAGQRPEQ